MDVAISAVGLAKHFGETRAVGGLDLEVPTGAVYGVLGPNGAGMTTAIRVLATLLLPTAGSARVFGYGAVEEAEQVRASVSLTGQFSVGAGYGYLLRPDKQRAAEAERPHP